jgi:pyruvate/2-oxoglutarate dehydrogenase complex dihydrolipoamide acyltransferase (E2) component
MIGENMSRSWTSIPRVTQQTSVDVFRLLELRKMINEDDWREEQNLNYRFYW